MKKLTSYIAPAAPATRRYADKEQPVLRPEVGFTPNWFHKNYGIDFGERWHTDPEYRLETRRRMRDALSTRFPGTTIGNTDRAVDGLTGTFGACTIGAIYGLPIIYSEAGWPICAQNYLNEEQIDYLRPPDLDNNPFFNGLTDQIRHIQQLEGRVEGFINWQGVLNNAHRLRGEALFFDLIDAPDRARHLFRCVAETMIDAAKRIQSLQAESGFQYRFFTVSNCLVNMLSPQQYAEFLLPLDIGISEAFDCIGIHNCAWSADPYLDLYARVPNVAYIDMGIHSDLAKAKKLFPDARRAIMYTPMDLADKPPGEIESDIQKIAQNYAPCDIVLADIEYGTDDNKILGFLKLCENLNEQAD